jgi:Bacteriophage minor capsid protein
MSETAGVLREEFDIFFKSGFGQLLADAGVGVWGASFTSAQVGIVDGNLPATPENAIGLMSYSINDDPTNSDSVVGLQVHTRASGSDPRGTARLTGKVFDQLHGLTNKVLPGGVFVMQCYRQSWVSIGQDENNRWREKSNFYVTVHRPSKYRV